MHPKREADASPRLRMEFGLASNGGCSEIEGRGATALHQEFSGLEFTNITESHVALLFQNERRGLRLGQR